VRHRSLTTLAIAGTAVVLATPPAHAYRLDRSVVPQPTLRYFVGLSDWKTPMRRVVKALNAGHVGVRLVEAKIPEQASIQIGRLEHQCGLPGVNGTTQTLEGGYGAIYLPRGCKSTAASIIAAHELGHALGLKHEDRRCALMNSSGSGAQSIPTRCAGQRHDWLRKPFRKDDLAGLKRLYRNTAPRVTLKRTSAATTTTGTAVSIATTATDRERNLSEFTIDFGDGTKRTTTALNDLPTSHSYLTPGTFTIRLTVIDYYLKRGTATVTVTVTA